MIVLIPIPIHFDFDYNSSCERNMPLIPLTVLKGEQKTFRGYLVCNQNQNQNRNWNEFEWKSELSYPSKLLISWAILIPSRN